jgi:prolyl oligopeptidase
VEGREPVIVLRTACLDGNHSGRPGALETESQPLSIAAISQDGSYLAYSVRHGGTDHSALEILDVELGSVLPDRLSEGIWTGFAFAPDGSGFYYSHRELHDPRPDYPAAFRHRFRTERSKDHEIFLARTEPNLSLGLLISTEANLMAFTVLFAGKSPRTSLYLQELSAESPATKLLVKEVEGCFVPFFVRDQLLAYTDLSAPNFRIVRIDRAHADPSEWHAVVPESGGRIQQFAVAGGQLFVTHGDRFSTKVAVFDLEGARRETPPFPTFGTIDLLNQTNNSEKVFYSHTSISEPAVVYCHDIHRNEASTWDTKKAPVVEPSAIGVEETEYASSDGTRVPIFLAARKDLLHGVPLPTFLTGYGGFASCVTPRFTAFATFLMEQGLLFAVQPCVAVLNWASSGIAPASAKTVRIHSTIFCRRLSGSFKKSCRYPDASQLAEAQTPACSLELPLPSVQICSALRSVSVRCSTWRDITSSISPRDGATNMVRPVMNRPSTL